MFCSIFLLEAFSDWCWNKFMEPVLCRSFQVTCWPCNLPVVLGFCIRRSNSLFQPCILAERVIYCSIKSDLLLLFLSSSEVFQKAFRKRIQHGASPSVIFPTVISLDLTTAAACAFMEVCLQWKWNTSTDAKSVRSVANGLCEIRKSKAYGSSMVLQLKYK